MKALYMLCYLPITHFNKPPIQNLMINKVVYNIMLMEKFHCQCIS